MHHRDDGWDWRPPYHLRRGPGGSQSTHGYSHKPRSSDEVRARYHHIPYEFLLIVTSECFQ